MLFNSYAFLLFLPLVWLCYFGLNKIQMFCAAQYVLIAASFLFYGYEDYRLCFLLAFSIIVNYACHAGLVSERVGLAARRILLAGGILLNLGLLFYFKYLNFVIENLNRFLGMEHVTRDIILPLGISFYTFQQLSFLIDSYWKKMKKYCFLDYCLFVAFFPQLVAGPIVLHQEMIPQFRNPEKRKVQYENLLSGMEYFIIGFAKKVLVADAFARICDAGYDHLAELNSASAVFTILAYTLQIYFDFSGYCDMALGLGRLFNIIIPINFDSPYKAINISDFWKHWHMTLTRFLTTYLYIPLGGNRKGMLRTCVNTMIVFTLSGLWHGAAWTYVLWGMLHGAAMVINRIGRKWIERIPGWISWLCTFCFVNAAWVFFRAEYFRQPWRLFARVFEGGKGGFHTKMVAALCENSIWLVTLERLIDNHIVQIICQTLLAVWFIFWTGVCVGMPSSHEIVERKYRNTGYYLFLSVLFVGAVMQLSQVSKFIYFNF